MIVRFLFGLVPVLWAFTAAAANGSGELSPLVHRQWFEARTAHFRIYSCGPTQQVAKLAGRLEQFRAAYALLAGTEAVASPPIVVMVFPDHEALKPFLPVYGGQPANLAAFFSRGSDENLIALSLGDSGADSLEAVFHEYAHLLLRHNELFWPLWLKEGMADIYGTFEITGSHAVHIGKTMPPYLRILEQKPLLPLHKLFGVGHDSPEYNERQRQDMFYAESWLLTHYLMLGDNPAIKARFPQLTALLRQGQSAQAAFTNAFGLALPAMERALRAYLDRGKFQPLALTLPVSLSGPQAFVTRKLTPVETCFRLGDQLLRVDRASVAEMYFTRGQKLAPASPLPYEGLGLLAAERSEHETAVRFLQGAIQRGSASYLAHYAYAREKYRVLTAGAKTYPQLPEAQAAEIRAELERSLKLMPDFGPAHHLLGLFNLVQEEDLATVQPHLQRAIQLEPENPVYVLTLAQAQLAKRETEAARRTLEPLCRPYVDAQVRRHAEEMLNSLGKGHRD